MEANKTQAGISELLEKFKTWGMLDYLTESEIKSVESDLRNLVGTAIMEANSQICQILPQFYNDIKP